MHAAKRAANLAAQIGVAVLVAVFFLGPTAAWATVTTSTHSRTYSPAVPTTVFTIDFPFLSAGDLVVTKTTIATGAEVTLTNGTDYTTTLPRGATQGYITTTSSVTSTHTLTIERVVPATQTTNFRTQGAYLPASIENALDKLTMLVQQLIAGTGESAADAVAAHVALSDPHTQYALLAGRSGGQHLYGGTSSSNNLQLTPNSNANNGKILLGSGSSAYLPATERLGLGTASPSHGLETTNDALIDTSYSSGGILLNDGAVSMPSGGSGSLCLGEAACTTPGNHIEIYGASHATKADEIDIDADVLKVRGPSGITTHILFDEDALTLTLADDIFVDSSGGTRTIYGGSTAGTALHLSSSSNGTKGFVYVGASMAFDEVYTRLGIGDATPDVALDVVGDSIVSGSSSYLRKVIAGGGAYTVVAPDDCGGWITSSTDSAVVTLPDAATANKGCQVTLTNTAASGAALVSFSPDSSDSIRGTVAAVSASGTANKDWRNTKATAVRGDYTTLVSDGSSSWYIVGGVGVWASEP